MVSPMVKESIYGKMGVFIKVHYYNYFLTKDTLKEVLDMAMVNGNRVL